MIFPEGVACEGCGEPILLGEAAVQAKAPGGPVWHTRCYPQTAVRRRPSPSIETFDYDSLADGIREDVRRAHVLGWDTCDSGDGTSEWGCAMPWPHLVIVSTPETLIDDANQVGKQFEGWRIEASYSPGQPAIILVHMPPVPELVSDGGSDE